MPTPIVNKAKVWAHHGRRRGVLGVSQEVNREMRKPKRKAPLFESIRELMEKRR